MRNKKRFNYLLHSPELLYHILVQGRYDFDYDLMPIHCLSMPLAKRLNLLKSGANLIYRRLHPWNWPIHMQVELTNYCNLKCKICPTGQGLVNRQPMAFDPALFKRLLDEAGPYLLTMSLWGWGESLLHPDLSEILRLCQNRGITTFISTNGQNLDHPDVIKALIDWPPTYLIVAIDGLSDETNSVYRTGSKIAPALRGIRLLSQMKREKNLKFPILQHRFIVMKHNEHELPHVKQFGADNHFDMCTIRTLCLIDAQNDGDHKKLLPHDSQFQAYRYKNETRVARSDYICEKAFTFPSVFADGTVVSCDQDSNALQPYGNLYRDGSFTDIWWGEKAMKIRRTIRDNMVEFMHCRNCPFKDQVSTDGSVLRFDLPR